MLCSEHTLVNSAMMRELGLWYQVSLANPDLSICSNEARGGGSGRGRRLCVSAGAAQFRVAGEPRLRMRWCQ